MSTLTKKAVLAALLGVAALAGTGGAARAQYDDDYDDDYGYSDPEIRQTVARVAYVSGDVSFARGDDPDEWQPANTNIPMTLGDRTWTAGGRVELQVHGGNLIRLARSTDLAALNLTEDTKQFSLSAGVASFRIRRLGDDEVFEVDTPNAAITFERTGDYRIDVRPDGDTRVQVRRGRAIVASGGGQVPLGSGDAMLIEGYEPPRYDMIGMAPPDGWDRWVADRDARYANVRSYDYVSADIAGVEDLDQYGRWQQVPNYGYCWTPATVAVGWQPYRVGRWIWQDPWGWTWVSSEPWGWAPYHYGRWVTWSSRWYWVPVAPRVQVVTYSPALVAFVGGGPGFSVSVGVGTDYIGWFPLAPRDPLIPWWGRPTTVVNVNVTNITYVNRTYVTVVNQNTFVSSRVVNTNYVRDKNIINRIERAPVVRGAIPIAPTRESIRVTTRQAAAPRPPAAVASRAVVTRMAPPPAPPRFDNKVAVIRENKGRPVTTVEAERISTKEGRAAAPARIRPATQESGRVTLAPKNDNARAPKPEPVAPSQGRQLATKEQPVAPSRETSTQRSRSAAPQRDTQADTAPKDKEQEQRDQAARQARDQAQSDRLQREQTERQQDRRPKAQQEPADSQKAQREQAQRDKAQQEQLERQQAQRDKTQREQLERQQAQRDKAQQEQLERQQAQRDKAQQEQLERQQAQREQPRRPTARPGPEDQPERSQAQSESKDKDKEKATTPQRGRGKPTPKPTPDKNGR
jgi:FecR protein